MTEEVNKFPDKIEQMVDQYVKLRDKLKEADKAHSERTAPARQYLEDLNAALLAKLAEIGGDSVKTPAGTVYRTVKKSASIADGAVFREYVIENAAFDLVDWRANATAVSDYIDGPGQGNPPPGVNYSTYATVGVRRGSEK